MSQYNAFYKGHPIFGPRGAAGPDGNPIGTIISYMGFTPPKDYLICDGSIYNISDYNDLAIFFKEQFDTTNYFGGDGTTTFAVPDMRNLFLRGYHGESEEQLSGDVGVKQEGTVFSYIQRGPNDINMIANSIPSAFDSIVKTSTESGGVANSYSYSGHFIAEYTSRPVNMAILYCIKATKSISVENVYSIEETRIGTWIDGKPLYRQIMSYRMNSQGSGVTEFSTNLSADMFSRCDVFSFYNDAKIVVPNLYSEIILRQNSIAVYNSGTSTLNGTTILFILEYTKTTDSPSMEFSSSLVVQTLDSSAQSIASIATIMMEDSE